MSVKARISLPIMFFMSLMILIVAVTTLYAATTDHMRLPGIGYSVVTEACPPPPESNNGGTNPFHNGSAKWAVDFSGANGFQIGTPVYAPASGQIIFAEHGWNDGYGNLVRILDDHGLTHYLAHLSRIDVSVGSAIGKDTLVGLSGDTGNGSAHLHWHVHDGSNVAVDLTGVAGMNVDCDIEEGSPGNATGPSVTSNPYNSCSEYANAFQNEPHIALFDNKDCRGNPLRLHGLSNSPVRYNLNVSTNFNDRTRSIHIPNGWSIVVGGNVDDIPYPLTRCYTSTQVDLDNQYYSTTDPQGSPVKIGYDTRPVRQNGWDMISYAVVSRNSTCPGSQAVGSYTYTNTGGGSSDPVMLFEHEGCTGTNYGWSSATNDWFDLDTGNGADYVNDITSCIVVDSGWSILVAEDFDGGGGTKCLTSTHPDLHFATYSDGDNIEDTISSLKVYNDSSCNGQATVGVSSGDTITVWDDYNYSGVNYGWHDVGQFNVPSYLSNDIGSIGITPGWSVAVYDLPDVEGGVRCYTTSTHSIGQPFSDGSGNADEIESVYVYNDSTCGGNLWMAELYPIPIEGNEIIVASTITETTTTETLVAGQPAYLDYKVINNGSAAASPFFSLSLWVDGQMVYENYHFIVPISDTVTVEDVEVNITQPGWHLVELVVDKNDRIDELIEDNNVYTTQLFWKDSTEGCDSVGFPSTVTFYNEANCEGVYDVSASTGIANMSTLMNDSVVSVHIPQGQSVKVYKDANASGQEQCLSWDYWDLSQDSWDDQSSMAWSISSLRVYNNSSCSQTEIAGDGCGSSVDLPGVVLFDNAYCDGEYLHFMELGAGTYDLSNLSFAWKVSSVHVPEGMSVKIENTLEQDAEKCLSWDYWDLTQDDWGNSSPINDDINKVTIFNNGSCTP